MTIDSFTGTVRTEGIFEEISTLTGVSFITGVWYTIQIIGNAFIKVANAELEITSNIPFQYKQGAEDIKINTGDSGVKLVVLENEGE